MSKRMAGCLGLLALAALIAGFLALVLFGAVGGVAMAAAPQATFGLTAPLLCAHGGTLEYHEVKRSYHRPGESEPHLECVQPDGKREDVIGKALVVVLAGVWIIIFLLAFLPLTVIFWLASVAIGKLLKKRAASSPGNFPS
jgi:hypothetical protein